MGFAPGADTGCADLIRSIRQEVWQPLSVIVGYAQLMAAEPDEATRAAHLGELLHAVARVDGLLGRLECAEPLETLTFGPRGEYRVLDLRARPDG
jgi:nitrogen-specific signal transduction histidine kinase